MSQATRQSGRIARAGERHRLGSLVAGLLAGAWREDASQSPVSISETELTEITPLLCASGSAAFAWARLRSTPLADTASGRTVREVYRRSRLSALVHEREIVYVFQLLRGAGIEPVLVKGWAVARRYPDRGLRPYGDIDLCVRPDQFDAAARALKCLEEIDGHYVDLHCGFDRIGQVQRPEGDVQRPTSNVQRPESDVQSPTSKVQSPDTNRGHWTALSARSQLVMLNGEPVRILSDEDHLRLLCSHLLRSGARRPPWLCDIALLVEEVQRPDGEVQSPTSNFQGPDGEVQNPMSNVQRPTSGMRSVPGAVAAGLGFDWDLCIGDDSTQANWIASTILLAHKLLGANIRQTPFADNRIELPRWLAPAVLQQWGGKVKSPTSNVQRPTSGPWTLDIGHWTDLYSRWDNPIRATAAVGGEFNNWRRLPYRLAESIKRAVS